jgi:hypothetical protein
MIVFLLIVTGLVLDEEMQPEQCDIFGHREDINPNFLLNTKNIMIILTTTHAPERIVQSGFWATPPTDIETHAKALGVWHCRYRAKVGNNAPERSEQRFGWSAESIVLRFYSNP